MNDNTKKRTAAVWWPAVIVVAIPLIAMFGIYQAYETKNSQWLGLCLVLIALL